MSKLFRGALVLLSLLIVRGTFATTATGPDIVHSTYIGGAGSDLICAIRVDDAGNSYVLGLTNSRDDFLADATVIGPTPLDSVVFVAKIPAQGGSLEYLTVVGGSGNELCGGGTARTDGGGLALLDDGSVVVTGITLSDDFPMVNAAQTAFEGPREGFAYRLMPDGQSLAFSTYILGAVPSAADRFEDGAVIAGLANQLFRPVNAIEELPSNSFVTRITAQGVIVFSTFFSEEASTLILDVAGGDDGLIYFGGFTTDADLFPGDSSYLTVTPTFDTGFVTVLAGNGQSVRMSELLGGTDHDVVEAIAVRDGSIFVTGTTLSIDFPTTAGAFQATRPDTGIGAAFVTVIAAPTAARGRAGLVYSTYFGPEDALSVVVSDAIAVDSQGRALITGFTFSASLPLTDNALDDCSQRLHCRPSFENGPDAYVTMFSADGSALVQSTFFGSNGDDRGFAIAVDASDDVYIAGQTMSSFQFPLVNPIRETPPGTRLDGFVARFTRLDQPAAPNDCATSCDGTGPPQIADLVRAVANALGTVDNGCAGIDRNGDGIISISELIRAVAGAIGNNPECL